MNPFDIIGPVMVGPSSSHTAGAVRLGRITRCVAGGRPVEAGIKLHGAFAKTYKGHGPDVALVAGLLGMDTDDERIPEALSIAGNEGLEVTFGIVDLGGADLDAGVHPNTVTIRVKNDSGEESEVTGSSIGGGSVVITHLNGFCVNLTGTYPTLVLLQLDRPGVVASVTGRLAANGVNIAAMTVARKERMKTATMVIELDQPVPASLLNDIASVPNVISARLVEPISG
ncbi:MAG: L-serine ammonia-lyase, iron-sulfur-dependent subunit beta [Bacillota bacterium]